jgi:hypothetical protein
MARCEPTTRCTPPSSRAYGVLLPRVELTATRLCSVGQDDRAVLIVECHPWGARPTGTAVHIGAFAAIQLPDGGPSDPADIYLYLTGRDTLLNIYGATAVAAQIRASIGEAGGASEIEQIADSLTLASPDDPRFEGKS